MSLDVRRIRALCFDVDGTLSDTDDQFVSSLSRWFSLVSFLFPQNNPRPFARRLVMRAESPANYLLGLLDRLRLDAPITVLGGYLHHLGMSKSLSLTLLISGVGEMLQRLFPHYPMAIVSARDEQTTLNFLNRFDLSHYFCCVVTGQTCRHTKPYPDPILYAAAKMGVPPETCLMIGDTVADIYAGRNAGAQTVGVLCGFGRETELRRAGAHLILSHTALLADVLLG
jgi:phosphoglycolate phosphatase-like HAD superfamily hydrolase